MVVGFVKDNDNNDDNNDDGFCCVALRCVDFNSFDIDCVGNKRKSM